MRLLRIPVLHVALFLSSFYNACNAVFLQLLYWTPSLALWVLTLINWRPVALSVLRVVECTAGAAALSITFNVLWQLLPRSKSEPPLVFHWIPFVGNAYSYGKDPNLFFAKCRKKVGEPYQLPFPSPLLKRQTNPPRSARQYLHVHTIW